MAAELKPSKCGYIKRTHFIYNKGDNILVDSIYVHTPRPPRTSSYSASQLPLTTSASPLHYVVLKPDNIITAEIDEEKICEVSFRFYITGYF
mmetsp:Transcript_85341/g.190758  ORF Transcript_85341/g.190758 Transcript_85341/m.190758 type:complete len:92 (-) Transcript_85341:538-813(-)